MELELTITGDDGYVSAISSGETLSCKPVSKTEILDMVDNFEKNKKFRVSSYGSSNGDQKHVVKETVERSYQSEATKADIELSRFKQDCRKRALDLASERVKGMKTFLEDNELRKGKDGEPPEIIAERLLIELAGKYYLWLIDIPE